MHNDLENLSLQSDNRPGKGGWCPGNYYCKCNECDSPFIGDKRATVCAKCAYQDGDLDEQDVNEESESISREDMLKSREDMLKVMEERRAKGGVLLKNIKDNLPELEEILEKVSGHSYEDRIYRFYHHSFKVYYLQDMTEEMLDTLRRISPSEKPKLFEPEFNEFFEEIIREGTGWSHKNEHNRKWTMVTRPIVEAFMHCKYFIEMAVKYGKELEEDPNMLPSGWAALLELYKIR